ncbi:putative b3 domain-containing protein, partial [Quercus suber]
MVKNMSSTTTKRCTRFFKVFLPEYCSERMRIPDAFVSQLDRSVPKKAILRSGNRKIWHVKVGKISDGVFFLNGWQEFVKDNLIELGDFLVFQYNGHDEEEEEAEETEVEENDSDNDDDEDMRMKRFRKIGAVKIQYQCKNTASYQKLKIMHVKQKDEK